MANPVVNGSLIKCDQACSLPPGVPIPKAPSYPPGMPGNFMVLPANKVMSGNQPIATIMDNKPFVNVTPFQMSCMSQSNPTVQSASASATAAAMGTPMFVPAPCIPSIPGPWSSGCATCKIANQNLLNSSSNLKCVMGGTITVVNTSAMQVKVP